MKNSSVRQLYKKHTFFLCAFAFMVLYQFLIMNRYHWPKVDFITFTYHAVDFGFGFCTRFLPGAIYKALVGVYSETAMSVYECVLLLLFYAAVALLLERLLWRTDPKNRLLCLVVFAFYLTGTYTFGIYIRELGMLDVYWLFFCVMLIASLADRRTVWLAIPLCFLLVLVHYSVVFCYLPFCLIWMLYKASCAEDRRYKRALLWTFWISGIVSVAAILYFLLFERSNLVYDMEEFRSVVYSRNCTYNEYYEYVFFRNTGKQDFEAAPIVSGDGKAAELVNVIWQQIALNLRLSPLPKEKWYGEFAVSVYCLLPILFLICKALLSVMRAEKKNKLKCFSVVCMMLLFCVTVFYGFLFSTDIVRWLAHGFLILFTLFLLVLYHQKQAWECVRNTLCRVPWFLLAGHWLLYASISFNPYS